MFVLAPKGRMIGLYIVSTSWFMWMINECFYIRGRKRWSLFTTSIVIRMVRPSHEVIGSRGSAMTFSSRCEQDWVGFILCCWFSLCVLSTV